MELLTSLILWAIFGGIAGWIATIILRRNDQHGMLGNIFIGIVGAFVGGFLFNLFGASGVDGFSLYSLMVAVIGSIVVLALVNMIRGGHASSRL